MTASSPTTTATTPGKKDSESLSAQPECDGPSRNHSKRRKAKPGWTTTRSASMTPGTGISLWPCLPWPSSRSCDTSPKRGPATCGQPERPDRTNNPEKETKPRNATPAPARRPGRLIGLTISEIRRLFNLPRHDRPTEVSGILLLINALELIMAWVMISSIPPAVKTWRILSLISRGLLSMGILKELI